MTAISMDFFEENANKTKHSVKDLQIGNIASEKNKTSTQLISIIGTRLIRMETILFLRIFQQYLQMKQIHLAQLREAKN